MKNRIFISRSPITQKNTPSLSRGTSIILSFITCLHVTGCQSTNTMSSYLSKQDKLTHSNKPKLELEQSLSKQLRSSFNYHSSTIFSHESPPQSLNNTSPKQQSNTDDLKNHCDNTHDNDYVQLLRIAQQSGNDIEDKQYKAQRNELIHDYQTCKMHYEQWYESYYYGDNKNEYLPLGVNRYDEMHTLKEVKQANRYHTYLYNPLEIGMSGTYQPLAGKFGMMPSIEYKSRNFLASTQQPIFFDLNAGKVYFWANSLAYLNSALLDDKLGTSWNNKWLAFSIKDERLPKDFGKSFIKAYLKAMKIAYQYEPDTDFSYVSAEQLTSKLPFLSQQHQAITTINTQRIISQVQTADIKAHQGYLFNKTLYDTINEQYPQLLAPDDTESNKLSKPIKEGKVAKLLITGYLSFTHSLVKQYEDEQQNEQQNKNALGKLNNGYDDNGFIIADFSDESPIQSIRNYGIKGNKISWIHQRNYLAKNILIPKNLESNPLDEPLIMDTLITFSSVNKTPFDNLPSAELPNSSNSIDAKQYANELFTYYESGNGTSFGKMFYEIYAQLKEPKQKKSKTSAIETEEIKALVIETDVNNSSNDGNSKSNINDSEINNSESSAFNNSRHTSDTKNKATFESTQCVLMSVNLEMMCSEDDGFDQEDTAELAICQNEKEELQSAYESYCH